MLERGSPVMIASSMIGSRQTEHEYYEGRTERSAHNRSGLGERKRGLRESRRLTLHLEQTGLPSLSRRRFVSAVTRSLHCRGPKASASRSRSVSSAEVANLGAPEAVKVKERVSERIGASQRSSSAVVRGYRAPASRRLNFPGPRRFCSVQAQRGRERT